MSLPLAGNKILYQKFLIVLVLLVNVNWIITPMAYQNMTILLACYLGQALIGLLRNVKSSYIFDKKTPRLWKT